MTAADPEDQFEQAALDEAVEREEQHERERAAHDRQGRIEKQDREDDIDE